MSLSAIDISALFPGARESDPQPIDPEAAIMRLREAGERYLDAYTGPRFKVGDIITPYADSSLKNAGEPHLVIASRAAAFDFSGAPGTSEYGMNSDIRVLSLMLGSIVAHWVESSTFKLWER